MTSQRKFPTAAGPGSAHLGTTQEPHRPWPAYIATGLLTADHRTAKRPNLDTCVANGSREGCYGSNHLDHPGGWETLRKFA